MTIKRYVLVDLDNQEKDYEYSTIEAAKFAADYHPNEFGIVERHYEHTNSKLVSPSRWPPAPDEPDKDEE